MLNMNRIVTIFLCSIVVSLFVGCGDYVVGIDVENQSNDTLLFCVKGSASDTLPPVQMLDKYDLISPGEEGYYGGMVNGPDDYTMFFDDRSRFTTVFIFRMETFRKYSYHRIRTENRILARYVLDLEALNALNWSLTYPPSQQMFDAGVDIYVNPNDPDE